MPHFGLVTIPTYPTDFAHLSKDHCPESKEAKAAAALNPYRQLIGSLMYLMIGTRRDLAQPLSVLSQFLVKSSRVHWDAALRLLAYVKATSHVGLRYTGETAGTLPKIIGTSDASWATHVDDCT